MAARRPLLLLAATLTALALPIGAASAEDGTIAHVESTGEGLRVLVNVPEGVQVDLSGVEATLDGEALSPTAVTASDGTEVKRTTVLAIDTSQSMARRGRFAAAKEAATTYLTTVPADVEVGIVTFDNDVAVALEPTTDRDAARTVVAGLSLAKDTLLYDGVVAAIDAAGDVGQRTVLVLSDGADTGGAADLTDVTAAITDTRTLVDVVSLGQSGEALEPLSAMAEAGSGRVIESSGEALAEDFRAEADVLASQVLVTAPLPSGFDASQATVEVVLPTGGEPVIARALAPIQSASSGEEQAPAEPAAQLDTPGGWDAPPWVLYAGIGVLGLGLVSAAMLLVPGRPAPMSIAERVEAYSTQVNRLDKTEKPASEPMLEQAKAAAAGVLERNSGLNERLSQRLAAAGSGFKPSEWLLVHVATVFIAGLLGFLISGSLIAGVVAMVIGAFLPPFYLRFRANQRRKAFDDALPDVLQLISGALSAGLSLAQAVDTVVREGPEPIASEFKRVLVEARIGMPLEDAFDGVAARFQSKDFAWSVMAIRIQRQVGGNLAELLNTVAATMRERAYLRRQVRTLSAEGRFSAIILCAMPPLFALFMFFSNREYLEPLVADIRGYALIAIAAVMMTVGTFAMSRLVKVDL